jgi:hypothetical protein
MSIKTELYYAIRAGGYPMEAWDKDTKTFFYPYFTTLEQARIFWDRRGGAWAIAVHKPNKRKARKA